MFANIVRLLCIKFEIFNITEQNRPEVSLPVSIVPTTVNPTQASTSFLIKTASSNNVSDDISSNSSDCGKDKPIANCQKGESRGDVQHTKERETSISGAPTPPTNDLASVIRLSEIMFTPSAIATAKAADENVISVTEANRLIPAKVAFNKPLPTSLIVYIKPFSKTKVLYQQKLEQLMTPSSAPLASSKERKLGKVESTTPSRIIYISLLPHPTKPALQE